MPSKVPALIDWLVAAFTAAPALGAATPQIAVYDGPATTGADDKLILWVGFTDPTAASPEPAAVFTQARGDMGALTRDESSEIRCAAEAWAGTDDMPTVRHAVFGIVAAVEALVRADATGFGGNASLAAPGVSAGELTQDNSQQGAVARVTFSILFRSFT
jgi:hypothetical protein